MTSIASSHRGEDTPASHLSGSESEEEPYVQHEEHGEETDRAETCSQQHQVETYLEAVFGDVEGTAHLALGWRQHHDNGRFSHAEWEQRAFRWPDEKETLVGAIREGTESGADVYVCPYLTQGLRRAKGTAVARRLVHADIDGTTDNGLLDALDAFVVASGSSAHVHVYVRLREEASEEEHRRLCRALGEYLGGADPKISDNDLLRPPGTLNHKTEPPHPVRWVKPVGERLWTTTELAELLGMRLASSERDSSASNEVQPIEALALPDPVHQALSTVTGDRSEDTYRVVAAGRDAGLTLEQVRQAVNTREDLRARLSARTDDDVASCWQRAEGPENVLEPRPDQIHSGQVQIAYRLAARAEGRLLFVHGVGWHYYDGRRWVEDGDVHAHREVLDALRDALAESLHHRELRREIQRCETASGIAGVLKIASNLEAFAVTANDMDADPALLNCINGTLDLTTGELRAHDPADRITHITRGAYDPNAPRAEWETFLERVIPDPELRTYLQRVVGQALFGKVTEHILPILIGTGANGKSTFYAAVHRALGTYSQVIDPSLLMVRQHGGTPTVELMQLRGARLVFGSETQEGRKLDATLMKRLTGGDPLTARKLYREPVTWIPSHTIIYVTNYLPKVRADDPAVWRRVRIIPFEVVVPPEEQDPTLPARLEEHADSILTWAVDGYADYIAGGMSMPAAVVKATDAYHEESDAVRRFINDRCVVEEGRLQSTRNLYEAWSRWAEMEGEEPMSERAFAGALDRLGFPGHRMKRGVMRKGLSLQ